MGILDQLFPDISVDPERNPVTVKQLQPEDWVVGTVALAAHQAMNDGMRSNKKKIDTKLSRPKFDEGGTISVATTLAVSLNYRRLLVQEQLRDVRFRPTSDDVLDGGIKNGSKVVIKIVPESEGPFSSWDSLVRASMQDGDGTPRDLTFDKFSVMSITEPDEQRYQIHETFGADIIQTFGRRPRILTLSGQVLNGKLDVSIKGEIRSMDWKNAFQRYYDNHFSAHACTKKGRKVRIFAQDTVWDGYMLNLVAATTAMDQGISQVTITFAVASRNFPRENDALIPGFVGNNGFVLSGKTTPDDYFSQPRLEHYFQDDFTRVVDIGILDLERERDDLIETTEGKDGNLNIFSNILNVSYDDTSQNYENPTLRLRMHKYLKGGNLEAEIISIGEDEADFNSVKADWNTSYGKDPEEELYAFEESDDPLKYLDYLEYKNLLDTEAYLRGRRAGLIERLNEMNGLSEKIFSIQKEINSLTQIKNQIQ